MTLTCLYAHISQYAADVYTQCHATITPVHCLYILTRLCAHTGPWWSIDVCTRCHATITHVHCLYTVYTHRLRQVYVHMDMLVSMGSGHV